MNELPVNEIMATTPDVGELAGERDAGQRARDAERRRLLRAADPSGRTPSTARRRRSEQAYAAGAIRPGVTLGDLRARGRRPAERACDGSRSATSTSHGDDDDRRAPRQPPASDTFTLGDYFLLVLRSPTASQGLAWERLNLFGTGLPAVRDRRQHGRLPGAVRRAAERRPVRRAEPRSRSTSTLAERLPLRARELEARAEPGRLRDGHADRRSRRRRRSPTAGSSSRGRSTRSSGNSYSVCFTARPGIVLGPAGRVARRDSRPAAPTASATPASVDRRRHARAERRRRHRAGALQRLLLPLVPDELDGRRLLPLRGAARGHRRSRST